jgi:uncharacterized cupredoxin-like copper-binding protein
LSPASGVSPGRRTFKIAGKKTQITEPNQTATLVVGLKKPGKYPYSCTVPGHAQAGMRGVFKVT